MGLLTWLYRLPGRINRSFGSTAAATNVGAPGALTSDASAMGTMVVIGEVEGATSEEVEGTQADPSDDEPQEPDGP